MNKTKATFQKLGAFLGSFVVFAISVTVLKYLAIIPLILIGLIIGYLDLPPNPSDARTLEAIGNIILFAISLFFATKAYKRIAPAEQSAEQNESQETAVKKKKENDKEIVKERNEKSWKENS